MNQYDGRGDTALNAAATAGHGAVVAALLAQKSVGVSFAPNGETPLQNAADGRHLGIVRMLLDRKDLNVNRRASWGKTRGRTVLMNVAEGGPDEVTVFS